MKLENTQKILEQTKDIYNRIASDFSNTRVKWWQGLGDFNKYVKVGDRVLDLGCGNGRMAQVFEDKKVEYLGVDNSEELIRIARERFKDKPRVRFEVGDILSIENCKLKIENYNLVLMIAVLHHIPTKKLRLQILKNIYSVLKPGGRLVLVNWNLWQIFGWKKKFRYWQYLWDWQEKIKRSAWGVSDAFVPWKPAGLETRRYIHSFGKGESKRLLKRAGFSVEKISFEVKDGRKAGILRGDNLLAVAVKK